MSRFLNRILGLPVKLQNQLFSYLTDTLVKVEEAEGWWSQQYDSSMTTCQHAFLWVYITPCYVHISARLDGATNELTSLILLLVIFPLLLSVTVNQDKNLICGPFLCSDHYITAPPTVPPIIYWIVRWCHCFIPSPRPPRQGKCRHSTSCEVGLRHRNYHVLSGSVLGVWTHIEGVFARHSTHNPRMQIVRVRTPEKRLSGKWT